MHGPPVPDQADRGNHSTVCTIGAEQASRFSFDERIDQLAHKTRPVGIGPPARSEIRFVKIEKFAWGRDRRYRERFLGASNQVARLAAKAGPGLRLGEHWAEFEGIAGR